MFQEYHALAVQASIMLHKFPDTVEQMMAMFLYWQGLLQRSFMKFQQNNCDPPRENRDKGDCTGTRAMTRHAKCVTMAQICAYLMTKTKSVTVLLFATQKPLSKKHCAKRHARRAIWHACQRTREQYCTVHSSKLERRWVRKKIKRHSWNISQHFVPPSGHVISSI